MYRQKITELKQWKNNPRRKPLIMRGARQVGKTWLLCEFGREYSRQNVYINNESAKELQSLFEQDYDVNRIVQMIQMYAQTNIDADTLIILDEIQAAPKGLTALKYFCEDAPQYHIAAAGSLPVSSERLHAASMTGRQEMSMPACSIRSSIFIISLSSASPLTFLQAASS